jgi:hypothetical protein
MQSNSEEFLDKKYTVVRGALEQPTIDIITQYALFDEMQNFVPEVTTMGDRAQVPNAHSKYADPAMEAMLLHMQPILEKATGLELEPTYSYYRVYRNGDDLKHHVDRESCEISSTLSFNYSYDPNKYEWPIYIGETPVYLKPGDVAVYRGMDLDHWRDPLLYEEDVWQVQAFLHYVDKNGPYAEFKWDNRPSIGSRPIAFTSANNKLANVNKPYIQYL